MEEQASRFIVFLRWIVFLPIGFVLGTVSERYSPESSSLLCNPIWVSS